MTIIHYIHCSGFKKGVIIIKKLRAAAKPRLAERMFNQEIDRFMGQLSLSLFVIWENDSSIYF